MELVNIDAGAVTFTAHWSEAAQLAAALRDSGHADAAITATIAALEAAAFAGQLQARTREAGNDAMQSDEYRRGFDDAMNDTQLQVDPIAMFDRPDYAAGVADARAAGWRRFAADQAERRRRMDAWRRARIEPDAPPSA